ncbi:MAG TPA: glycosylasparaginase [Flavobacteriales bacterium]|nr:glycosylasparaginase [Flavobacteriales bacterium]
MLQRRAFIRRAAAMAAVLGLDPVRLLRADAPLPLSNAGFNGTGRFREGHMLSTWYHGMVSNEEGWKQMQAGGTALDAVVEGTALVESDATGTSVGLGGRPDRTGRVTLDACVMGPQGDAGGVCFLEDIEHPVKVARAVMEETPHVLLAGDGARDFALAQGFEPRNLLTPESKTAWEDWKKSAEYKPIINVENHDTIGMIAQDLDGNLAGACTTSGLAYKLRGRVGDSPIIGAGLFVDNEIGACTATGLGEAVMKTLGSFLVVELIRQGRSPQQACEEAVDRIMRKMPVKDLQVGYLAMDTKGRSGSFAIHKGFNYARTIAGQTEMIDAAYRS